MHPVCIPCTPLVHGLRCLRTALVWSGLSGRRYRYRRGLNYPTEPGAERVPAGFEDDAVGAGSPRSAFRSHFRELVAAGSLGSQAGARPASASADGRTRVARAVGICEPASAEASFGGGRRESLARRVRMPRRSCGLRWGRTPWPRRPSPGTREWALPQESAKIHLPRAIWRGIDFMLT